MMLSSSVYPVGTPVIVSLSPYSASSWSTVAVTASKTRTSDSEIRFSATSKTIASARSTVSVTSSGWLYADSAISPDTVISRRSSASSLTILA